MFCLWISCCSLEGVHWSSPSIRLVYTIFTLNVATDIVDYCVHMFTWNRHVFVLY